MKDIGFEERSFRLKIGKKGWAFIFDDNGEIYQERHFESKEEAMNYIQARCGMMATPSMPV